jgi:aminopeptidase YwaD
VNAYEYCRHLVETWPNRWTGSPGEKQASDWFAQQLAGMGYDMQQTTFPVAAWDYEGTEFYLEGQPLDAGAQFYSVGCDVRGPLVAVRLDEEGGLAGDARGKTALVKETNTREVNQRNRILLGLQEAGALAVIIESEYADTYSTKMFRTPESRLPAAGVSGQVGGRLFASEGKEARLVVRAHQRPGTTVNVFGEKGPLDGPVILIWAHTESSPACPGAYDNAAGVGIILEMAQRMAKVRCGARLRFAVWGGHEFGAFGSTWYVRHYPHEARNVRRMLGFDGSGARDSDPQITVWGGEALTQSVRAFAEKREAVKVTTSTGGAGDATAFLPLGVEAVWASASRWRRGDLYGREDNAWKAAAPFHSPIDDMRWIRPEAMARDVQLGMDLLQEWLVEFGVA